MLEDVAYQIRTPEFWNACTAVADERDYRLGGSFFDGKGQPARSRRSRTVRPPRASTASTSSTPHAASADRSEPLHHEYLHRSPGQGHPRQGHRPVQGRRMHRRAGRRDRRQHPFRIEQRFHQRHRRQHRTGGHRCVRQARRHGLDQRVRRCRAGTRGAPCRRPGPPGPGEPGVHAGHRQAELPRQPHLQRIHCRDRSGLPCQGCCRFNRAVPWPWPDRRRLPRRRPGFPGHRQQQRQLRLPAHHQLQLHLHRAHRGWPWFGLGGPQPEGRRRLQGRPGHPHRHAQGHRIGRSQGAGAGQVHGDPGAGRSGGPDQLHDELLQCSLGR